MSDMDEGDTPFWGRFCVQCACQMMMNAPETGRSGLLEVCPECGCVAHEERSEYDGANRPKPHDFVKPPCNWVVYFRYQGAEFQEAGLFTEADKDRCVQELLVKERCNSIHARQLTEEEILARQKKSLDPALAEFGERLERLDKAVNEYADKATDMFAALARRGLPLCTRSGRMFYVLDPQVEDICIEDIAYHLSNLCRFAGAVSDFYSVCEHSVRGTLTLAALGCDEHVQLAFLLHDAAEAYCIDLPRPLKRELPGYREIENTVSRFIYEKYDCELDLHTVEAVEIMDARMLSTERRDLMPAQTASWPDMLKPLHEKIVPWSPRAARIAYLGLFHKLTAGKWRA